MTTVKFQFYLVSEGAEKTSSLNVRKVRLAESDCWFLFPDEYTKISNHKVLLEQPSVKAAITSIKTRSQYRNVYVSLTAEQAKQYMDDDGNFLFNGHLLAELHSKKADPPESAVDDLVYGINKLANREESVKNILKHFLIEKFSPKSRNPESWCTQFDKECARFNLSGAKQIEVFKSCLEPSMSDWFCNCQFKFGIDASWSVWRADLIATFGDRTFNPIRYAYTFKFIGGSYIDYAVKKEKMLRDLDKTLPECFMLNLIVIGLPLHVQGALNRDVVSSIRLLHAKLKKYESEDKGFEFSSNVNKPRNFSLNSASNNSQRSNNFSVSGHSKRNNSPRSFNRSSDNRVNFNSNQNFVNKKPCPLCVKKGFPNRFHPESECWFVDLEKEPSVQKSVNSSDFSSVSLISATEEPKNLQLNH